MSKRNDKLNGNVSATASNNVNATGTTGQATNGTTAKPTTPEELLAEAQRKQAEADRLRKEAEEAAKAAEEAAKKAEEEAKVAKEAARKAREEAIAEAKAAGKFREAWLPKMADGSLGRPYGSPHLAEQASPIGTAEKRLCWGATSGPIGDPLTAEEMAALEV